MKLRHSIACLAGFLFSVNLALAQTADFGDRAVELRGISSDELAKPEIPDDAVAQGPGLAFRPIYLIKRYYSVVPWLRAHVRSVISDAPGFDPANVQIDTGDDVGDLQLVNEKNESRLGLAPGTVATHPAYGLYCLRVVICVPWDNWPANIFQRFYVRFSHRCPYICWWDHWWYYWRSPLYAFQVTLEGAQEVPPNSSPATGSGTLFLDPIYRTLGYDLHYSGLVANFTASHIHGPAPAGVNAGVLFPLNNIPSGATAGRLFGSTPALTSAQIIDLRNGLHYANVHSSQFPGGEIRGQLKPVPSPVFCPWRPSWIPLVRWGRGGPLWCLTLTHPYGYPWDPFFRPRPFCIYGLRHYFTPIGSLQNPTRLPFIGSLTALMPASWSYYPIRPVLRYWPYTGYCARWYWWRVPTFSIYRHLPPCVQFATYVDPDLADLPGTQPFPEDPVPPVRGTTGITTLRALVSQQSDITGDGFVSLQDLSAFRQENGGSSQDGEDTDGVTPTTF